MVFSHLRRSCALLLILSICVFASSSDAQRSRPNRRSCKCMPGDACYPTPRQWQELSSRLSYPLITNQRPLGAACYRGTGEFNSRQCSSATTSINDPIFRAGQSNAAQFMTFEALANGTSIQDCTFDGPMSGTCYQGRIPPMSVNVTNAADVQEAVRFASRHNLRLVVRNSGYVNIYVPKNEENFD